MSRQSRRNLAVGLILLVFALAVYGWVLTRGGALLTGRPDAF
jgi:hypothetical protein